MSPHQQESAHVQNNPCTVSVLHCCQTGEWQHLANAPAQLQIVSRHIVQTSMQILAKPCGRLCRVIHIEGRLSSSVWIASACFLPSISDGITCQRQACPANFFCSQAYLFAGTWAQVMDVSKTFDFEEHQKSINSPASRRREAALQSRATLMRGSLSASMAGSIMPSLSFGASIGSSIAASSQTLTGPSLHRVSSMQAEMRFSICQVTVLHMG